MKEQNFMRIKIFCRTAFLFLEQFVIFVLFMIPSLSLKLALREES
jgi:hypothetical protein